MSDRRANLHQVLRQRICLLDYAPGTRLSETDLAQEFGTSRTPLRRALARLEDEGLVRSLHGVGTIVTDIDLPEMDATYALREELAELAGTLAPLPVTDTALATLDALIARGDTLRQGDDPRDFARLNLDYFLFGLSLTGNDALRETSERLYIRTARIWLHRLERLDLGEEIDIFLQEMHETRRALMIGDTRAAALIRRVHISMCRKRLLSGDLPD